jgi:hypothetical protein
VNDGTNSEVAAGKVAETRRGGVSSLKRGGFFRLVMPPCICHDGTAEGFPGLVYDQHLRMIERLASSAGDADQDAVAGFERHRDASIDRQREGVAAVTNVGYLARPVQMELRQRRLREQFDAGLEDRWLVVAGELRLDAQPSRQQ